MPAYYNEFEPYAADWIRNLVRAGHVADGVVDDQSIVELRSDDLNGYEQCHFFAGIGVWSHALRLAGVADDFPVWTASLPCQPFSQAGRREGTADDRHLWPVFFELLRQHNPPILFGEQVSSPDGLAWFDAVRADLEGAGYAVGALDAGAASCGAPHIRQRLYFVAIRADVVGDARGMADACRNELQAVHVGRGAPRAAGLGRASGLVGDTGRDGDREHARELHSDESEHEVGGADGDHAPVAASPAGAPTSGFWGDVEWRYCRDDRYRPVKPGIEPLVDGSPGRVVDVRAGEKREPEAWEAEAPSRVGMLRAYGNSIVAPLAATFIASVIDVLVGE